MSFRLCYPTSGRLWDGTPSFSGPTPSYWEVDHFDIESHDEKVLKRSQRSSTSECDLPLEGWSPFVCPSLIRVIFATMIRHAANLHDGRCVPAAIQRTEPPLVSCFYCISIMQIQPQPVTLLFSCSTYSQPSLKRFESIHHMLYLPKGRWTTGYRSLQESAFPPHAGQAKQRWWGCKYCEESL